MIKNSSGSAALSLREQTDDDSDGEGHILSEESPFILRKGDYVYLKSPTFGDSIKIYKPKCKIGTSKDTFKDLKHVEE